MFTNLLIFYSYYLIELKEDVDKSKSKLNLAKPKSRKNKIHEEPGIESVKTESAGNIFLSKTELESNRL